MVLLKLLASETKEAESLIQSFATSQDHSESHVKKTANAQRNFLLGRAMLRSMLANVTGDSSWQLHIDAHGKPYVVNAWGIGPHVSISHSYAWVACALCLKGEVGIDIERWKPRNFNDIARYAFGPEECDAVEHGGQPVFYRIWTLREAMAKASGEGVLRGMDGKDAITFFGDKEKWTSEKWHLYYQTPQENYSLAVAVRGNEAQKTQLHHF